MRTETDSLGPVAVPSDRLWGAQTQRSLENFPIGDASERMPLPLIHAFGLQKQASARANRALGVLPDALAAAIDQAAGEVAAGRLDDHFPLVVWQTGSGTQTNMNANEVVSNRAIQLMGGTVGSKDPVHPNDHVNRSQSSNDSMPTAMHIAAALQLRDRLRPALIHLITVLDSKAQAFDGVVKIGRTHLMDAVPLTLGQELSAFVQQLRDVAVRLDAAELEVQALAQGGTAVGSGLNAPEGFADRFCQELAQLTGIAFRPAPNLFAALAGHDALMALSGVLSGLATVLMKLGNDIRLLASGPRAGLAELSLPANEPGSSIMPGKVNPTQAEALTMVSAEIMGNHQAVTIAAASGHLQLNVFKPMIALNILRSIALAADAMRSFADRALAGMEPDQAGIAQHLERSLMLVTALTPEIGYDAAAKIAKHAHETGKTLRQAALDLDLISAERFDAVVRPETMVRRA